MSEYVSRPREGAATEIEQELKPPPRYKVLMHNDDYTTMDFVVQMLRLIFRRTPEEAVRIMLSIHKSGVGVCGVFPAQIAETKIELVHATARKHGYPLLCSMEPE